MLRSVGFTLLAVLSLPALTAQAQSWGTAVLTENDPPYYDGRIALVRSADASTEMLYLCARSGESQLIFQGGPLERQLGTGGAELTIDVPGVGRFPVHVDYDEESENWVADVAGGAPVLAALRSGNAATLALGGGAVLARFGLNGSSAAIGGALAYCKGAEPARAEAPRSGPAPVKEKLALFLLEKLRDECKAMGGTDVGIDLAGITPAGGSNPQELVVDYGAISCKGGPRGVGQCGAAKCLHEHYVPGVGGWSMVRDYLDY